MAEPAEKPRSRAPETPARFADVIVDPRLLQANERTFLAWVRTSVGIMAFGFVIARLGIWLREVEAPDRSGASVSVMIGAGVVFLASLLSGASAVRFLSFRRALREGRQPDTQPTLELALAGTVAALGIGLAMYLLVR